MDKPDPDTKCPATGHKKPCRSLYMNCPKWISVQGQHPQTGEVIDRYGCSDAWLPILLIENSQQQRGTQAAVESFRNEMVAGNQKTLEALLTQQLRIVNE